MRKEWKYSRNNNSKEERQFKFALLRSQGFNHFEASRMRDYTLSRIKREINLRSVRK
jgi:hypothetical protein